MAATVDEISRWFDEGFLENCTHMIVVCDEFDWDDYPVFVNANEDVREVESEYNGKSMQRVMEVYILDPARKAEQMIPHKIVHNYV